MSDSPTSRQLIPERILRDAALMEIFGIRHWKNLSPYMEALGARPLKVGKCKTRFWSSTKIIKAMERMMDEQVECDELDE